MLYPKNTKAVRKFKTKKKKKERKTLKKQAISFSYHLSIYISVIYYNIRLRCVALTRYNKGINFYTFFKGFEFLIFSSLYLKFFLGLYPNVSLLIILAQLICCCFFLILLHILNLYVFFLERSYI